MMNKATDFGLAGRWQKLVLEFDRVASPVTRPLLEDLGGSSGLAGAMAHICARRLGEVVDQQVLVRELEEALMPHEEALWADLDAVSYRDPACQHPLEAMIFYKGYQSIAGYRAAHSWWHGSRQVEARYLQSRMAEVFTVDIHPACEIGEGLMIDHAHNVVIGETARIGKNCSILHGVTLGGTGKVRGDRHPKIGDGVMIGAGAKILGNVQVGHCVRVASGSVVTHDVEPNVTVAGVPAKVIGDAGCPEPSTFMAQEF